ncbi:hypothetical protein [Micromonospora zhanjiangensis]|uniref:Uncharacterized protein n=1 Tax=Micromonospora zhanjiangensis TaxID=1522057 RepID=A0ABV8KQP9_9ACTN
MRKEHDQELDLAGSSDPQQALPSGGGRLASSRHIELPPGDEVVLAAAEVPTEASVTAAHSDSSNTTVKLRIREWVDLRLGLAEAGRDAGRTGTVVLIALIAVGAFVLPLALTTEASDSTRITLSAITGGSVLLFSLMYLLVAPLIHRCRNK